MSSAVTARPPRRTSSRRSRAAADPSASSACSSSDPTRQPRGRSSPSASAKPAVPPGKLPALCSSSNFAWSRSPSDGAAAAALVGPSTRVSKRLAPTRDRTRRCYVRESAPGSKAVARRRSTRGHTSDCEMNSVQGRTELKKRRKRVPEPAERQERAARRHDEWSGALLRATRTPTHSRWATRPGPSRGPSSRRSAMFRRVATLSRTKFDLILTGQGPEARKFLTRSLVIREIAHAASRKHPRKRPRFGSARRHHEDGSAAYSDSLRTSGEDRRVAKTAMLKRRHGIRCPIS